MLIQVDTHTALGFGEVSSLGLQVGRWFSISPRSALATNWLRRRSGLITARSAQTGCPGLRGSHQSRSKGARTLQYSVSLRRREVPKPIPRMAMKPRDFH